MLRKFLENYIPASTTADLDSLDKEQLIELLKTETAKCHALEAYLYKIITHLDNCQRIAHIGSWELDLAPDNYSKPVFWTNETYRILGFDPNTFQPTVASFLSTVHPDDRQHALDATETAIKEGKRHDLECRIVLPDGTEKTVRALGEVVRDEETNKPLKIIGVTQDITDIKNTSQNLARAHEQLKTLFEKISETVFTVDMINHTVLQMSVACEKIYGYTADEFLQNPNLWFDLIVEEDKHVVHAGEDVLKSGMPIRLEYRIVHKNGDLRWLLSKIEPTLNAEGVLVRIDGINSDITKRKDAEDALKFSEAKFRSMIERSSDGIVISNAEGTIEFATTALTRITGFTLDEISQTDIMHFFHPDDVDELTALRSEMLTATGNVMKFKARFCRKDGEWIWIEGLTQNRLEDPAIKGLVTNYRDITERMTYEEVLKESNDHLQKTNKELDRFVYSVSHDLRAPLASIMGAIEYSESVTDDPEMLENLAMMKGSAKKLDGFILDILEYSRNTRTELKNELVDFKLLLQDVTNNLKFMGGSNNNVAININVSESALFYSDWSRLSIILNNVVSNAIRYSDPKVANPFVTINVLVNKTAADITVTDNGIGIDPKHHDRIFDMFFRASSKSIGSGLGLYIVKEAVEKLHGLLTFESETGKGTKFLIHIPNSTTKQNEQ